LKKIGTVLFVGMNPWHMREIYDTVRFLPLPGKEPTGCI